MSTKLMFMVPALKGLKRAFFVPVLQILKDAVEVVSLSL